MASNRVTEGESEPDDHQIFETKLVKFKGYQVQIVKQDTNGPSPLIAVCNFLLLKNKFVLDSETVSAEILLSHVADQLLQSAPYGNPDQDLNQAIDALARFSTGIDVNFRFNKIDAFVDTPDLAVFRLLKIPLYHGWIVDPQDSDTAKAFGSKPYNTVIQEVADFRAKNVLQEYCSDNQKGKGDLEEEEALLQALELSHHNACNTTVILGPSTTTSVNSSMDVREPIHDGEDYIPESRMKTNEKLGPAYESEVVVAKQVESGRENDCDRNLSPFIIRAKGLLMHNFLNNNRNQLTTYGLCALQKGLKDGELCVFFRNDHFNTMLKRNNELYLLATYQGYDGQPDLVWEKLNEVNGDTVHVTGDFNIFRQKISTKDSRDEQNALTRTNNYFASSGSSVLSNDEQHATDLLRKECENELRRQPTSRPASRLTTGPQVEPGSLEDLYDGAEYYQNDSDSEGSIPSPVKH